MPHRPGMRPLEEQVREALDAGITMLQLREKYLSEEDFLREALSIRKLTERYHVPLIINDSLYVAINSGADGIHIGQSDLPAREVRAKLGPDKILGVTAKTVAQALEAEKAGMETDWQMAVRVSRDIGMASVLVGLGNTAPEPR